MAPRSLALAFSLITLGSVSAQALPLVTGVAYQPFAASTQRLIEALDFLGAPVSDADRDTLYDALVDSNHNEAIKTIQTVLDGYCIAGVDINPESRVKVAEGPVEKQLQQHGWRTFLVKVHNKAGVTAVLRGNSPNAAPVYTISLGQPRPDETIEESDLPHRFLELEMQDGLPLKERLSGFEVEYRIIQLYSRDRGPREATLSFDIGQGTQDIGFRNEVAILFECIPAVEVKLQILDHDGQPTTAAFEIRDQDLRVYPTPGRRLAPDFWFHSQVYRHSGETVLLPAGEYDFIVRRGPEYAGIIRRVTVPESNAYTVTFLLRRWIHLAAMGYYSGDHHIHAAGCAHYESPTKGVGPEDMWRHMLGEDLNVGCVLSWGPCWYHQKENFEGKVNELTTKANAIRYDVEVSGFPSSHAGHLTLLRLQEDDFPGTSRLEKWPTWDLPVLQWAKQQDAVVGFSHSGFGLAVPGSDLPNFDVVPAYDGIGANEYIVDVTHDAVDFLSTVNTPAIWELNIWYHTLNCGFRTRISGETDFPCIYGERVGIGRSYVKIDGELDFDAWVEGIRDGRGYVSDGQSHLVDFTLGGLEVGTKGTNGVSQLDLDEPRVVEITAKVAAFMPADEIPGVGDLPWNQKPFWHIERARIPGTRKVPVEVIVNGNAVAREEMVADGEMRDVKFEVNIDRSSWVALRILPTSHTNPIFVHVGKQPIRASRKSAEWCLKGVDVCWESKKGLTRVRERAAAKAAYDHARKVYKKIIEESSDD